jgi:exosome complex RNA-binding protein Rrp4
MTAQKRETGRNYIGLLHEEAEERRIADLSAAAKPRIMDHIIGLMAAMFSRRGEAR